MVSLELLGGVPAASWLQEAPVIDHFAFKRATTN
jgi:hypothetical protein